MKKIALVCTILFLAACSDDSDSAGSTTTNDFNEVYEQLQESAPSFTPSFVSNLRKSDYTTLASLSNWDTASTTFSGVSSSGTNPQGYVSDLFDSSVDQSIFERAKMPFLISCTLDMLGEKTGDLFTTGSQTITLSSSVVGVCGSESDFSSLLGQEISFTVANASDTTNYDQIITMSDSANAAFSSDQWMYVRNTDDILNFMHVESNASGSEISVSSISYDKSTEAGEFQFITKYSGSDVKLYRIVMDPANDDARVFAYKFNNSGSVDVTVNVASTFNSQDFAALSISWTNQSAPFDTDVVSGNACISTADGSIVSGENNSLTCSGNSKTVLASSGASTIATAAQAINGATIRADADAGDLADNLPTFSATTILSSGIQL